jgi:hypothetical protein
VREEFGGRRQEVVFLDRDRIGSRGSIDGRDGPHHAATTPDFGRLLVRRNYRHLQTQLDRHVDIHGLVGPNQDSGSRDVLGATDTPIPSAHLPVAHRKMKRKPGSPHLNVGVQQTPYQLCNCKAAINCWKSQAVTGDFRLSQWIHEKFLREIFQFSYKMTWTTARPVQRWTFRTHRMTPRYGTNIAQPRDKR